MINGFTKFKEWFKGFENQYVVIGGTACDLIMELSAHEQAEDSLKFLGIMEKAPLLQMGGNHSLIYYV